MVVDGGSDNVALVVMPHVSLILPIEMMEKGP